RLCDEAALRVPAPSRRTALDPRSHRVRIPRIVCAFRYVSRVDECLWQVDWTMTAIVLLVLATSCLWLSSLAASTVFFGALWRLRWSASLLLAYPLWWYSQLLITRGLSLFNEINQRSLIIAT